MLKHASKFVTPSQLSILKLGLSLHVYSPKVEMFEQIANERDLPPCPAVADVGGKLTCNVEEMKNLIGNVSLFLYYVLFLSFFRKKFCR